ALAHGCIAQAEQVGHLAAGFTFPVEQGENFPAVGRQGLERGGYDPVAFIAQRPLFGTGVAWSGKIDIELDVPARAQIERTAQPAPEMVARQVARDLAQPGQKAAAVFEMAETLPDSQIGFLSDILAELNVANDGQSQRGHGRLRGGHQGAEGLAISAACCGEMKRNLLLDVSHFPPPPAAEAPRDAQTPGRRSGRNDGLDPRPRGDDPEWQPLVGRRRHASSSSRAARKRRRIMMSFLVLLDTPNKTRRR